MVAAPLVSPEAFTGMADAVKLARSTLDALSSARQISEIECNQLQVALDSLGATLKRPAQSAADFAVRLANLQSACETLPEIARALFDEEGSDAAGISDVVVWTDAVAASIQGHQRDVDALLSWARLTAGEASPGTLTLGNLPDHCQALIEKLAQQASPTSSSADDAAVKNNRLIAALKQSAAAAEALTKRIESLDQLAAKMFDDMQFGFLLDPARQLLSIGYQFAEDALDPSCYDLLRPRLGANLMVGIDVRISDARIGDART
jgi:hypothetical protein